MTATSKILLITDDAELQSSLSGRMTGALRCVTCHAAENPMDKVFDELPHVIVVDEEYGGGEGKRIALRIKEDVVLKYIPILLLVKHLEVAPSKKFERIDRYLQKTKGGAAIVEGVRELIMRNHHELDVNPLTHLPGTRSSILRIERAIHSKQFFAVCCLDLSALSAFNSAYGDARGDEIIVHLAEIVKNALKMNGGPNDFVGHLGGDDIIIVTHSALAVPVAEAIIQEFDSTILNHYDPHDRSQGYIVQRNKDGELARYSIMSVSVAIVHNDYMPINEMAEISHIAGELKKYMQSLPGSCYIKYRRNPKEIGDQATDKGSVEVHFADKMKRVMIAGSSGGEDKYAGFLNALIKNRNVQTYYQPIVDIKNKRILGYEALTRALSDYPVDEASLMFSVARETGRVKELDKLCVDYALGSAQKLPTDAKLFLNLNHETLIDHECMKELFSNKGVIGFKNIVIEVTEQSILRSFDKVRDALHELKQQGLSVAIDDVGGGAVSLRDVAVLKPDFIKFDRSLVRQIDISTTKQQIVLSMILFAKGINAMTVAEGIETREEYETAHMCGVNLGQGYYFSRPGPPFPVVVF